MVDSSVKRLVVELEADLRGVVSVTDVAYAEPQLARRARQRVGHDWWRFENGLRPRGSRTHDRPAASERSLGDRVPGPVLPRKRHIPRTGGKGVGDGSGPVPDALTDAFSLAAERTLVSRVEGHEVPHHIAIIMDGNRRWARQEGRSPVEGHEEGRDTLENVVDWCLEIGVEVLTVYAFSTENFERKPEEVQALMDLFEQNFYDMAEDERVHEHEIRIRAIGRSEDLPGDVQEAIDYAEAKTADYDAYHYNIAVAYGGREELVSAIKDIARDVEEGKLDPHEISEQTVNENLYTYPLPDPDLILRTSGEERISNFLLWQLAYSELYFADVNWPGLRKVDFLRAIRDYQKRNRRYGE